MGLGMFAMMMLFCGVSIYLLKNIKGEKNEQ